MKTKRIKIPILVILLAFLLATPTYASYDANHITIVVQAAESYISVNLPQDATIEELMNKLNLAPHFYPGNYFRVLSQGDVIVLPDISFFRSYQVAPIYYETIVSFRDDIPYGSHVIIDQGQEGSQILDKVVFFYNDEEVSQAVLSYEMIRYPVSGFKQIGRGATIETSRGTFRHLGYILVEATAYSAEQTNLSNYTATGERVRHGIIAVDPEIIPLGTYVYIPGYGVALAADTGGSIVGNKIDLAFETISEALMFGRQFDVKVYILDK